MSTCGENGDCGKKATKPARTRAKEPPRYRVLLHNDDLTPSQYVVSVLRTFFHFAEGDARTKLVEIREQGAVSAGIYTFEIAETKVALVTADAEQARHPLECTMEREEE